MQKITPHLWFDTQAEDAARFYTSVFRNGNIGAVARYPDAGQEITGKPAGSVMTVEFEIEGFKFIALNGGPYFKINPAISFMVNFDPSQGTDARKRIDEVWEKLCEGGTVLMPLDTYSFSERYGWIQDRFGVSWQLIYTNPEGERRPVIIPAFLFTGASYGKAEEATDFYLSVFDGAKRGALAHYETGQGPNREGTVAFTDFMLAGQWFAAMDGGGEHAFTFNEGVSLLVTCDTQDELDRYWEKLSAVPESEQCGWLKDRYGVAWQIAPSGMAKLFSDPDKEKVKRAMEAMLKMKKLDIAALERAAEGHG